MLGRFLRPKLRRIGCELPHVRIVSDPFLSGIGIGFVVEHAERCDLAAPQVHDAIRPKSFDTFDKRDDVIFDLRTGLFGGEIDLYLHKTSYIAASHLSDPQRLSAK